MIYAFSPEGLSRLDACVAARPLLAFDIDGTLAPIVDRPVDARLSGDMQACLDHLGGRAEIAIITGRAVDDARRMLTFVPRYLISNHGAEGVPGWEGRSQAFESIVRAWRTVLDADATLQRCGVLIEDKRYSLSLHFRGVPDIAAAAQAIERQVASLQPAPRVIAGKAIANLLPAGAPDKGDAMRALMAWTRCGQAMYIGDDDTDENIFRLQLPGVLNVRVEQASGSAAGLYLRHQGEVLDLVRHIARHWPADDPMAARP